jgi:hypothetical protein
MAEDETIAYFQGLKTKTDPLRGNIKSVPAKEPAARKPVEVPDEDYKYMSKQAEKIGDRLSKSASKRYSGKAMPKR